MVRVMLVDDSSTVRGLVRRALSADGLIEIVDTASNGALAIPIAKQQKPDVIILDIEMPEMDGITALPKLLEASPDTKIIMASTLTLRNAAISMKALELGASDCVAKPVAGSPEELGNFYRELSGKIHALAGARKSFAVAATRVTAEPSVRLSRASLSSSVPFKALAIASSTGGPQALMTLFSGLKGQLNHIPIFITQHMPPNFTTILAENLARAGGRPCGEGKDGEIVQPGRAYLAPGDFHMVAQRVGQQVMLHVNQELQENFCRPAADPMFRSLSQIYGAGLLALVLTGMGSDGLEGAKAVLRDGGQVIAQDEATSVVWGMPRAVTEQGLCKAVLPMNEIAPYLARVVDNAGR